MANGHSEEFKRDAVHIALSRGLTRRQVASDLGMGVSTLNTWSGLLRTVKMHPCPTLVLCARLKGFAKTI